MGVCIFTMKIPVALMRSQSLPSAKSQSVSMLSSQRRYHLRRFCTGWNCIIKYQLTASCISKQNFYINNNHWLFFSFPFRLGLSQWATTHSFVWVNVCVWIDVNDVFSLGSASFGSFISAFINWINTAARKWLISRVITILLIYVSMLVGLFNERPSPANRLMEIEQEKIPPIY